MPVGVVRAGASNLAGEAQSRPAASLDGEREIERGLEDRVEVLGNRRPAHHRRQEACAWQPRVVA